jgi:hypothetical protein
MPWLQGSWDDAAHQTHAFAERFVHPKAPKGEVWPLAQYDSWGYGQDIDEGNQVRQPACGSGVPPRGHAAAHDFLMQTSCIAMAQALTQKMTIGSRRGRSQGRVGTITPLPRPSPQMEALRRAISLGIEAFVLDLGWARAIGDWTVDKRKFPRGLSPLVSLAHAHGLRFGLHLPFAQVQAPLGRHHQ